MSVFKIDLSFLRCFDLFRDRESLHKFLYVSYNEPMNPHLHRFSKPATRRRFATRLGMRARLRAILEPDFPLKRWMLLPLAGVALAGFGLALILRDLNLLSRLPRFFQDLFVMSWVGGSLLILGGLILAAAGMWRVNREMVNVLLGREQGLDDLELVDTLVIRQQQRKLRTGPKIVVIGGGTGMPSLLRGLRNYTDNITAVVTVADDGGSSGLLRQQMGMLPPGDFRNNIAALSDNEGLMTQLMQYRFGDQEGLGNHNFGNLFIATMAAITGSFESGIAESSRVLAVRGRILPSTLENVTLCAEIAYPSPANGDGAVPAEAGPVDGGSDSSSAMEAAAGERFGYVRGESRIPKSGGRILRVHLEPEDCRAYPKTVQAILDADLILAAPGSFFTSLLPNLLVPYVRAAISASPALRLYVCNVATQAGETDNFTVSDHMYHLQRHAGDAFTHVLANDNYTLEKPPGPNVQWVTLPAPDEPIDYHLHTGDLVDEAWPWRHDPAKVAARVMEIYEQWLKVRNERL